jgi:hypothetical protein
VQFGAVMKLGLLQSGLTLNRAVFAASSAISTGVVSARLVDLDHLSCDDVADRVIANNQVQQL